MGTDARCPPPPVQGVAITFWQEHTAVEANFSLSQAVKGELGH